MFKVNADTCIGCGLCVVVAEKTFAMESKSYVINQPETAEEIAAAENALA